MYITHSSRISLGMIVIERERTGFTLAYLTYGQELILEQM
jgi:hypothetical protein